MPSLAILTGKGQGTESGGAVQGVIYRAATQQALLSLKRILYKEVTDRQYGPTKAFQRPENKKPMVFYTTVPTTCQPPTPSSSTLHFLKLNHG